MEQFYIKEAYTSSFPWVCTMCQDRSCIQVLDSSLTKNTLKPAESGGRPGTCFISSQVIAKLGRGSSLQKNKSINISFLSQLCVFLLSLHASRHMHPPNTIQRGVALTTVQWDGSHRFLQGRDGHQQEFQVFRWPHSSNKLDIISDQCLAFDQVAKREAKCILLEEGWHSTGHKEKLRSPQT